MAPTATLGRKPEPSGPRDLPGTIGSSESRPGSSARCATTATAASAMPAAARWSVGGIPAAPTATPVAPPAIAPIDHHACIP
jgi:hypothetical protein